MSYTASRANNGAQDTTRGVQGTLGVHPGIREAMRDANETLDERPSGDGGSANLYEPKHCEMLQPGTTQLYTGGEVLEPYEAALLRRASARLGSRILHDGRNATEPSPFTTTLRRSDSSARVNRPLHSSELGDNLPSPRRHHSPEFRGRTTAQQATWTKEHPEAGDGGDDQTGVEGTPRSGPAWWYGPT